MNVNQAVRFAQVWDDEPDLKDSTRGIVTRIIDSTYVWVKWSDRDQPIIMRVSSLK